MKSSEKGLFCGARDLRATLNRVLLLLSVLPFSTGSAGLVINEVYRGNNAASDYVEFLITSDITLQQLDSIWFGDSKSNTGFIDYENNFNSTQIISNSSYFNSTTDLIKAGTLLAVGGSAVTTDFNYNPTGSDSDSWNITLGAGQGFDTIGSSIPFDLNQNGEVIWASSAQPANRTDSSNFITALAMDTNPGALGDAVGALADSGGSGFQLITGPEFDGRFNVGNSISNLSGEAIDFSSSETSGGSTGVANSASNLAVINSLRAVPEPSTFLFLFLSLAPLLFIHLRKQKRLREAEA